VGRLAVAGSCSRYCSWYWLWSSAAEVSTRIRWQPEPGGSYRYKGPLASARAPWWASSDARVQCGFVLWTHLGFWKRLARSDQYPNPCQKVSGCTSGVFTWFRFRAGATISTCTWNSWAD